MGQGSSAGLQVLIMGLDSAGKSTLVGQILTGQTVNTSPTVGFNVGTLELNKQSCLTLWDVGGQKSMRQNWQYYLDGCKALVFVVDSTDVARIPEAQKALKSILSDERLRGVPLMVLANKKDLPNSMTIREVSNKLNLNSYTDRKWEIQACSATKGLGVQQAFLTVNKLIKRS
ncbi:ADP-ribosylation factor-like protein 11 [Gambusia affinis]|uniref:ADP-ribosylation factor-like protein 11 n=1 Tax=Gambusia affinis TaxID=33528 RepID=UPI001CDCF1D9|nr:ADP-ribosylation factor-like protein 11 [Gambusia affinis]